LHSPFFCSKNTHHPPPPLRTLSNCHESAGGTLAEQQGKVLANLLDDIYFYMYLGFVLDPFIFYLGKLFLFFGIF